MMRNSILRALLVAVSSVLLLSALTGCMQPKMKCLYRGEDGMKIETKAWGEVEGNIPVQLYRLTNTNGMQMDVTNYGCIVVRLLVPDAQGEMDDVVLGYNKLDDYVKDNPYFGAVVGRYGNRIAGGQFKIGEKTYSLATNNGPNHLHGGIQGFDKIVWDAQPIESDDAVGIDFRHTSPHMAEGYPGTVEVRVRYLLNNQNEFWIYYEATADKATHLNLTHHSYFNLQGHGTSDVLDHKMMINASRFTPVDENLIPTGELRPVEGTPFDFTEPTAIGKRIDVENQQLEYGGGYDHNWVLNKEAPEKITLAARVTEPDSGRVMEVYTTEPGIQFYSGNFLDSSNIGKDGKVYKHRYGFCLETQHFPDSPNKPEFPSTLLEPGQKYETKTIYKFKTN